MIHIRKRFVIAGIIIVLGIFFVLRVNNVQSRFPQKRIEECREGEVISYNPRIDNLISADTEISPVGISVYSGLEFLEKYPEMAATYSNMKEFESFYMIVPEVEIKNKGKEVVNIERLVMYFQFTSPYNGYTNGVRILNDNDINPDETKIAQLAVLVNPEYIGRENLELFFGSDFYILMSSYPIEKRLIYEKK